MTTGSQNSSIGSISISKMVTPPGTHIKTLCQSATVPQRINARHAKFIIRLSFDQTDHGLKRMRRGRASRRHSPPCRENATWPTTLMGRQDEEMTKGSKIRTQTRHHACVALSTGAGRLVSLGNHRSEHRHTGMDAHQRYIICMSSSRQTASAWSAGSIGRY